jgi:hypothetical protein
MERFVTPESINIPLGTLPEQQKKARS